MDLNATQSAIRAGYSPKTANRIANENLSKLDVQNYIKELRKEQSNRTKISADNVVEELKKVAFADVAVTGKEKVRALELLGKHLGMFNEKLEFVAEDEVPKLLEALKNDV